MGREVKVDLKLKMLYFIDIRTMAYFPPPHPPIYSRIILKGCHLQEKEGLKGALNTTLAQLFIFQKFQFYGKCQLFLSAPEIGCLIT